MFDVVVVCGPTASGKSALAIEIAKRFDGEIVSADSMQIYKEMNIGTAKPTVSEMAGIPHHLIDIISVTEEYSVSSFVTDAHTVIDDILSRGKLPVIAGGTGLYIDSLINNIAFQENEKCDEVRENLKNILSEKGEAFLFQMLSDIDPDAAQSIHPNNVKRVMRALEINLTTGKSIEQNNIESRRKPKYNTLYIGVNYKDREILYSRINSRVDSMIENGLLDEARYIFDSELSSTASGAIGYKELFNYFKGDCLLSEAIELLKQKTRNYAKRQITWFKKNTKINWFYPDDFKDRNDFTKTVIDLISDSEV